MMLGTTNIKFVLTSSKISYVFQDTSNGCCVQNRCKFRRKLCSFQEATFHRLRILSIRILFRYTVVFLTLFTAVTVIVLSDSLESGVWSNSLKLFFLRLAVCFFLRMTAELMGTSRHRLLFALDSPDLDNFGEDDSFARILSAFLSEKLGWVLKEGRMQERRRVIIIQGNS